MSDADILEHLRLIERRLDEIEGALLLEIRLLRELVPHYRPTAAITVRRSSTLKLR